MLIFDSSSSTHARPSSLLLPPPPTAAAMPSASKPSAHSADEGAQMTANHRLGMRYFFTFLFAILNYYLKLDYGMKHDNNNEQPLTPHRGEAMNTVKAQDFEPRRR